MNAQAESNKITRIVAREVLGEFNYEIKFDDNDSLRDRLRVIYAPNGRGKTNLLSAVKCILGSSYSDLQNLVELPVAYVEISLSNGATIKMIREDAFSGQYLIAVKAPAGRNVEERESELSHINEVSFSVSPDDFSGRMSQRSMVSSEEYRAYRRLHGEITIPVRLVGADRLVSNISGRNDVGAGRVPQGGEPSGGNDVVENLLTTVERTLTRRAIAGMSNERGQFSPYLEITNRTLNTSDDTKWLAAEANTELQGRISSVIGDGKVMERYGLLSLKQLEGIQESIKSTRTNNKGFPQLLNILGPYIDSLEEDIRALKPAQRMISNFIDSVNGFFDRKKLEFNGSSGLTLTTSSGAGIQARNLSSGERHLLVMLSQSLIATSEPGLIIIDEPEISLGIDWQRNLLEALLYITEDADVQFLVASHSVQIMGEVDLDDIIQPFEDANDGQ